MEDSMLRSISINLDDTPSSRRSLSAEFRTKMRKMALPLSPLVQVDTGHTHPDFPRHLVNFWLLTDDQLDSLATFYHQRHVGPMTHEYPLRVEWPDGMSLEQKRRRFGRFIGLRGCDSPALSPQQLRRQCRPGRGGDSSSNLFEELFGATAAAVLQQPVGVEGTRGTTTTTTHGLDKVHLRLVEEGEVESDDGGPHHHRIGPRGGRPHQRAERGAGGLARFSRHAAAATTTGQQQRPLLPSRSRDMPTDLAARVAWFFSDDIDDPDNPRWGESLRSRRQRRGRVATARLARQQQQQHVSAAARNNNSSNNNRPPSTSSPSPSSSPVLPFSFGDYEQLPQYRAEPDLDVEMTIPHEQSAGVGGGDMAPPPPAWYSLSTDSSADAGFSIPPPPMSPLNPGRRRRRDPEDDEMLFRKARFYY